MKQVRIRLVRKGLLMTAAVFAGCGGAPELEPAASANELGDDVAYVQSQGVEVRAKGDEWDGDREVLDHVTPVYLSVINRGSRPVQVAYSTMSLLGSDGQGYAALPPFEVEGTIDRLVLAKDYRISPRIGYSGFAVAPHYGSVYSAPPAGVMHGVGLRYYREHYPYWEAEIELPTSQMLEWALPEGVVKPGGTLSGYVYFQKVPAKLEYVTLDMELVDANSGERFGIVRIPFENE